MAVAFVIAFRPQRRDWGVLIPFLAGLVIPLWILLAPPWRWGILGTAASAYLHKAMATGGHSHPWYAYLQWIAGLGYSFTDAPILLLGAAGVWVALRSKHPVARFVAIYAGSLVLLYSAVPYKTPWCAVSLVHGLALLGGVSFSWCYSRWGPGRTTAAMVVLLTAMAVEAWIASVPFGSDPRNPWAYAHTGRGVYTIRDRVDECARIAGDGTNVAIDVFTRENLWPLPWYFRRYPNVRWWRDVPPRGRGAPVVLLAPSVEESVARMLYEGPPPGQRELYVDLFPRAVELRPGIEVRGYVAKSLWDRRPSE
jgi:predicted membrane-bound mannosyltransferase